MKQCPKCGNWIEDHQQVCNFCGEKFVQPYPRERYPPSWHPPRKPVSEKLIIGVIAVVIIVVLAAVFGFFLLKRGEKGETKTMSWQELRNDMTYDGTIESIEFKSLDPGDTVVIRDKIESIEYVYSNIYFDYYNTQYVTIIDFESTYEEDSLYFLGDATNYYIGDEVAITFHVIEIDYYGTTMEYFAELWDENRHTNRPPSVTLIKLSSRGTGSYGYADIYIDNGGSSESDVYLYIDDEYVTEIDNIPGYTTTLVCKYCLPTGQHIFKTRYPYSNDVSEYISTRSHTTITLNIHHVIESVGGTISRVTGGWKFTCTSGTKDFLDSSTYVFIQTETGGTVLGRTLLSDIDTESEYNIFHVWFFDNNADNKLNAGDTIFIHTDSGANSDDIFQIVTSTTILYDCTLP